MNSEMNSNADCTMLLRTLEATDMGETLKERIMFTAPTSTKERLKAWAEAERRTISNLCEGIVLEALEQWEETQKTLNNSQEKDEEGQS
jgi:hypothetical protein